ncbi:MAG: hypothetical protein AVDCRST_MAG59-1439, partial [uncultured Thermomicrobiales bacterium]
GNGRTRLASSQARFRLAAVRMAEPGRRGSSLSGVGTPRRDPAACRCHRWTPARRGFRSGI